MTLDQVPVHVADQSDRAAETEGAKTQEVQYQLPQGVGRMRTDGGSIAQGDLLLQSGCPRTLRSGRFLEMGVERVQDVADVGQQQVIVRYPAA